MQETEQFRITNVRSRIVRSQEIAPSSAGFELVASADVECKTCLHTWNAREIGRGAVQPIVGGYMLQCPQCSASGTFRPRMNEARS